ncbi:hypothetical protein Brsp05_04642 [Brucella sp. NBRC 12953]|uniref:AAA family ATPase n=1 Tax=Brucella sp. NBRC 12953 TaxID=3075481 RepID=UPI0030AAD98F
MKILDESNLSLIYNEDYQKYLNLDWAKEWRRNYSRQIQRVEEAGWEEWKTREFQESLWDSNALARIGPGSSVTVHGAYEDQELAKFLYEARGSLAGIPIEERGNHLQRIYNYVLDKVYPRFTKRRPKARLTRLLATIFPDDMTSIADASRIWGVQRLVSASRVRGDFISQHPTVRAKIQSSVGNANTIDDKVDQAIFAWYLWQTYVGKPDEGAIINESEQREASALPPFSLLPANAQRRSLTCVKGNIDLLLAMVREAEQGITREELVGIILEEATQLNTSSAGNIISQAMGGLGLLRMDGLVYRPTDRGQDLLNVDNPATVLRGPLIGRVFGMGHLLLMVRREPGTLKPTDAAKRLRELVPTWTSTQPGSYICTWARLVGLIDVQNTGQLILTDDGEDYAAALPSDFEEEWRIDRSIIQILEAAYEEPTKNYPSNKPDVRTYNVESIIDEGCFLAKNEVSQYVDLLRRKKNIILQGPPGTGKTWLAKRLGYALIGEVSPDRLTSLQFQPTLSYEDFVRGWRPDGTKGLQLVDGAFLDAVNAAKENSDLPYVLVIEEINRGNPAQILGEMLTLIEDSKRNEGEALRPAYPRTIDERIYVPDNLYIIGTMNLADRSLALVDLALRRRFSFISLSPQFSSPWKSWMLDIGAPVSLVDTIARKMTTLNSAIENDRNLGPQFQVGHSFMTPFGKPGTSDAEWASWYLETVKSEIAPLLQEYWFDNITEAEARISDLEKV